MLSAPRNRLIESSRGRSATKSPIPAKSKCVNSKDEDEIIEHRKKNSNGETAHITRYAKGRLLGKGGFAKCYLVTAQDTKQTYAMKIVPKRILQRQKAREKLASEIKIHRTLQHPRVVRFDLYFEDRENVYILLELCHNHTLHELIRSEKRFPENEVRRFITQIISGLQYCHSNGVIHRDLKLGNLFLDRNWNIKMGDFGLAAKLNDDNERKRTMCGTPNYIAPEILDGSRGHSYEVDIWSLGVILFTLLVGRPPYESTDVKATYKRILENKYAFPKNGTISECAKSLVRLMLQTVPADRPSLDEILNHPFIRGSVSSIQFENDENSGQCSSNKKIGAQTTARRRPLSDLPTKRLAADLENQADNYEISRKNLARFKKPQRNDPFLDVCPEHRLKVNQNSGEVVRKYNLRSNAKAEEKYVEQHVQKLSEKAGSGKKKIQTECMDVASENPPEVRKSNMGNQPRLASRNRTSTGGLDTPDGSDSSANVDLSNIDDTLEYMFRQLSVKDPPLVSSASSKESDFLWLTQYVDYCSKYGLGYVLSNGSIGVYFNDATKIITDASGHAFQYWHRVPSGNPDSVSFETHTLDKYPDSLIKKVTLMLHFRNHLLSQMDSDGNSYQSPVQNAHDSPLIHLKKFIRTKNAFLFRLSNRSIHVIFSDGTELVMKGKQLVKYVNKDRSVDIFGIGELRMGVGGLRYDVLKRLNYTKDMLAQIIPSNIPEM